MSKFADRMKGPMQESVTGLPEPTLSLVAQYMGQDPSAEAGQQLPADVEHKGSADDPPGVRPRDESDPQRAEPSTTRGPTELSADYGKVGEHVASMLEAARAAALKIQDEARADAHRVAERTREEAAEILADARSRASRLEAEAAQMRAEAAEGLSRTQHMIGEQTRTAEGRRTTLEQNVTLAEERLGRLVGALRELATTLEDVLQRQPAIAPQDVSASAPGPVDPLRPAVKRARGSRRKRSREQPTPEEQ